MGFSCGFMSVSCWRLFRGFCGLGFWLGMSRVTNLYVVVSQDGRTGHLRPSNISLNYKEYTLSYRRIPII